MGCSKSSSKREVYSYRSQPQERRKISNKESNLTPKGTRERRTNQKTVKNTNTWKLNNICNIINEQIDH